MGSKIIREGSKRVILVKSKDPHDWWYNFTSDDGFRNYRIECEDGTEAYVLRTRKRYLRPGELATLRCIKSSVYRGGSKNGQRLYLYEEVE